MKCTGGEILIEKLMEWGVDTIFGIPGDGINGVVEALRVHQAKIRFIQVRHEESAAFMACAYAKLTGRLGVCLATSGPGGIHLLNGLYDAKLDGQPVLAITGLQFHDLLGTHTQQDVALDKLFMDVAVFNERIMSPSHVEALTDQACRTAIARRGVAHLTIPADFQSMTVERSQRSKRNIPHHTSAVWSLPAYEPEQSDLKRAAEILNASSKIAILVGQGALHARAEVSRLAETLGAPVIKALLGKAVLPDDHPYCLGGIGLLGTLPSQEAMEKCDTLLMIGTSFPYLEFYPKPEKIKAIQIDIDPARIGLRCHADVGIVGDCQRALSELIPLLEFHKDRSFVEDAHRGMKDWRELMHRRASVDSMPLKPQRVAHNLGLKLNEDAIVVSDTGTITSWFAQYIPVKSKQLHTVSGNLATMACGLPYAIAAQLAYPDRQVVAFVGDGGLTMLMGELATCVKYKLPIKIIVIKNNTLGQIKWEQIVFLGNPEFACELQPIDFVGVARAFGFKAVSSDNPKTIDAAVTATLEASGPSLLEALVDPLEAPMPPKVTFEQAEKFTEALLRGTPQALKTALTVSADRIREMV